MLGRHHISLSVATVAIIVLPLFPASPEATLLVLVGTAIGSLVPDADSPDAAIFHTEVTGLDGGYSNLVNALAVLNPVFGFTTKYLIYKPAVRFYDTLVFDEYDIGERHRGFLHSFLGVGTATVLTAIYLFPVLIFLGLLWLPSVVFFMAGYLVGALLHLLQDSCTKSGIQWNFPFQSWEITGQLTTTAKPDDTKYQRYFLTMLGAGVAVMFLAPSLLEDVPVLFLSGVGVLAVVLGWGVFAIGIARCSVDTASIP